MVQFLARFEKGFVSFYKAKSATARVERYVLFSIRFAVKNKAVFNVLLLSSLPVFSYADELGDLIQMSLDDLSQVVTQVSSVSRKLENPDKVAAAVYVISNEQIE